MAEVQICFHDRLNDLLAPARRGRTLTCDATRRAAIKDVIESLGVPHTEVDAILVDGASVGFEHILAGGERVEVYPWPTAPRAARHLRPTPPARPRFVLDAHLGRLARSLRLLGFDCRYRADIEDAELAAIAEREARVVLTRDRALLRRRRIRLAHWVRHTEPRRQVEEVCDEFDLVPAFAPFTRCARCNGRLRRVEKAAVAHRLAPLTRRYATTFLECEACGRLYWHGSHVARLQARIEDLRRRDLARRGLRTRET